MKTCFSCKCLGIDLHAEAPHRTRYTCLHRDVQTAMLIDGRRYLEKPSGCPLHTTDRAKQGMNTRAVMEAHDRLAGSLKEARRQQMVVQAYHSKPATKEAVHLDATYQQLLF